MTEYLVYRCGSNAANQHLTNEMPVAIVRAKSRKDAAATTWGDEKPNVHGCPTLAAEVVASCGNLDVWGNQHTYAVPQSKARASDWNAILEADSMRQEPAPW